jgi:mitochondrial intermediate peptidase
MVLRRPAVFRTNGCKMIATVTFTRSRWKFLESQLCCSSSAMYFHQIFSQSLHTLSSAPWKSTTLVSNRRQLRLSNAAFSLSHPPRNDLGLFSLPELQTPMDFEKLTKQAIKECNKIRSSLASIVRQYENTSSESSIVTSKEEASHVLEKLDDISKIVCNVIDAAELCRNVHSSDHWRTAANTAFIQLSAYLTLLNGDTTLYEASKLVSNTKTTLPPVKETSSPSSVPTFIWDQLSEEEQRFTILLQAEFEREGIHLPEDQRLQVHELQTQIVHLESTFMQNITSCRKEFIIDNWKDVTDVIPSSVLHHMGVRVLPPSRLTASEDPLIRLDNTDGHVIQSLLRYSTNASLRRKIFMEYNTSVKENLRVLDELIKLRHELAQRQGFKSYVERNVIDKMAGSGENVMQFLQMARAQNQASFSADMTIMSKAKEHTEGDAKLEPWDISFYTGFLKSRPHGDLTNIVSQYFTVANTLQAMQVLVQRLFGIEMREEALSPSEQWDVESLEPGNDQPSTTRLQKFVFTAPDGRPLGTLYFDLYPREEKYGHAAQFTVRCGCALNQTSDSSSILKSEDQYQYPIVVLVCNLVNSPALNHSEVETLFHEFGHALHSLLSRTRFQHMSGTRAAMDFVEAPSHLLENYVWDAGFLPLLGQHAETGAAMPDDLIQQLQQSRYLFASIERQNQILYSFFDQKLFGIPDPTVASPTQLFSDLHRQFDVPYMEGTHWHSRFSHLVSYGAGYYGYLYSEVFARDIWNHLLSNGRSLDRSTGDELWNKLLRHGGAKDPRIMLTDLLGRPPKVDFTSS